MKFVELNRIEYYRGGYVNTSALFAIDDISRIMECIDDLSYTNIITKDGKVHTINERYGNVIKKLRDAGEEYNG